MAAVRSLHNGIIPLREKIGNYDIKRYRKEAIKNYTTTRENWELRPAQDRDDG